MTDMVDYEVSGGIARLTMNNPPLNALGHGLRSALAEALDRAEADVGVKAIVLLAGGRSWPVGADIREFGKPPMLPHLPGLCARFFAATKPVIAALHGSALGGGLELALVAAVRVADKATSLGLPEVTLGILPGAGGTQRLPRLIGAGSALQMILSGAPVTADAALALGLIDKIAPGPVADAAMAIAEAHVAGRVLLPVVSRRKQPGAADAAAFLADVAKARAEARSEEVGVAGGVLMPRVDLELRKRLLSDIKPDPVVESRDSAQVSLNYEMPLGGGNFSQKREAAARMAAAQADLDDARLEVQTNSSELWNVWSEARNMTASLGSRSVASDKVVTAYDQQFNAGRRSLQDLIAIRDEHQRTQADVIDNQHARQLGAMQILALLGRLRESLRVSD